MESNPEPDVISRTAAFGPLLLIGTGCFLSSTIRWCALLILGVGILAGLSTLLWDYGEDFDETERPSVPPSESAPPSAS